MKFGWSLALAALFVAGSASAQDTTSDKGKISSLLYVAAIGSAFVNQWIADGLYVLIALIWVIPDRRIERVIDEGRV